MIKKYTFFVLISILLLSACSKQVYIADINTDYYRINYKQDDKQEINDIIAPYKDQLDAQMDEVLAYNPVELVKKKPNSLLGNWFADVLYESANESYGGDVAFAANNYGGFRLPSIPVGDLTLRTIYELMPFDNVLVILELKGPQLKQLIDRMAATGGWPISKGLQFTIDNGIATDIKIQDQPIDMSKSYRVALPDYVANGGDRCDFLIGVEQFTDGRLIRDVVADHLRSKTDKQLTVDPTSRIKTYIR